MRHLLVIIMLFLPGCPVEENVSYCDKVMKCEVQEEMFCERKDSGCGKNCYYYIIEDCWEDCK